MTRKKRKEKERKEEKRKSKEEETINPLSKKNLLLKRSFSNF